ncbi:MAG: FAD-dependent oxidoreductase [Saprospiraceae bacterium]|nr:FAD-dependent oxidoreductase [Saprospiraceae bacterium]
MKRRDFIKKGTLLGSVTILNARNTPSLRRSTGKAKSVIIIGAGFAGLAAGMKLKENDIKVTILESRNRIGGRVFSHQPNKADGQVIELGAEWVGSSHERIISMCREFGLKLDNNQFETDLLLAGEYKKNKEWSFSPQMDKFWAEKTSLWESMSQSERMKLDKTDWWRLLSNKGFSELDLWMRELIDSTDFGESIRHTSGYAAFAEYAESSEKNEMDFKISGGNSMLAAKMISKIGVENISLNHHVVSINQDVESVTVICNNGKYLTADRVICAIPTLSILKLNWNPYLPGKMIEALNELQYSRIGKFPIVFSERFWKREDFDMITDTPAHYFYHGTKNQKGKQGVLMCYAIGEKADVLASVNSAQRRDIILEALKPAFGDVRKFVLEDLQYYWGQEKYSGGAYAFYGKNQWFELMPTLKQSFQNIYFAGEHLADWQGFMEGAINSGEEAADQILNN